jgi:hypothetical protein
MLPRNLCVERRGSIGADEFEDATLVCSLLPGPASTQLATLCAWRIHGTADASSAGSLSAAPFSPQTVRDWIARPHEPSRSAMLRPMTSGPPKIAALLLPKRHHELAAFVVIEQALRDEGTSLHYLPASRWSYLSADIRDRLADLVVPGAPPILHGSTWTTDAPFRETARDVARHRAAGILGVEMEAAALYAYAEATGNAVLCLAHLTNELGSEGDFEKGASDGAEDALQVIEAVLHRLTRQ